MPPSASGFQQKCEKACAIPGEMLAEGNRRKAFNALHRLYCNWKNVLEHQVE
jgi:hypothetical protein